MIALGADSRRDADSIHADIEKIYADTRSSICSYLRYLGVPAEQAQEATQEVFLRLYQTMRNGTAIDNTRAWLFRVAHNLGVKVRRRERAFRVTSPDWDRLGSAAASSEEILIDRQRDGRIAAAMETLSPQQRHCLYLRSEGLRYREIAGVTSLSISSVNEYIRRAIAHLAEAAHG